MPTAPMELREKIWGRIASHGRPSHLDAIRNEIPLADLPAWLEKTLAGQVRGRVVIRMNQLSPEPPNDS